MVRDMKRRDFLKSSAGVAAGAVAAQAQSTSLRSEPVKPGFHLGAVTYNTLKDYDLDTLIRVLEKAQFEAVELRTGHKHGVEPSIGSAEREKVRARFAGSRIRLTSYGTTTRFQSADPSERDQQLAIARTFVDLARDTGAMGIKIQPMGFPEGVPIATSIKRFGDSLHQLGDYGAERKIEIWVEVHGPVSSEPIHAAELMQAANHRNVGLCWNSNETDVKDGSVKESFALLRPWIRNVHINELADPKYPWRELFTLLRTARYDRYTLAEVAESKDPERFFNWYRALWTELNRECS